MLKIKADTIQILVVDKKAGNFVYLPAVYHASPGDPIRWQANGNWAVQFINGAPLEEGVSIHGPKEVEVGTTVADGAKGVYHYVAALEIDGRVYLDGGCPTIVIG